MRQVVNAVKGSPLLGHSSCMALKTLDSEDTLKSSGPRQQVERERRLRREIANSNERRRMQSINQGYQMLKGMLPSKDGGEKLSKAAVLQNAADHMQQLLDDNKTLFTENEELKKALNSQLHKSSDSGLALKRRKRDTESSDEGISMSYPTSAAHDRELIDELRRDITELRVQLEREKQRRMLLEQSYTYMMAAQVAQQKTAQQQTSPALHSYPTPSLSPIQSRHNSTDESQVASNDEETTHTPSQFPHSSDVAHAERHPVHGQLADMCPSEHEGMASYGKLSTVASQNLSIIVEAINHLEGDKHLTASEKEVDSGVSHGELSDDTKSDCSRAHSPQPPPAHQSSSAMVVLPHHPSLYTAANYDSAVSPVPLLYRPTFLSNLVTGMQSKNVIVPPPPCRASS